MTGKSSFVLYADMIGTIKKVVEDDRKNKTNNAGELFLHILEYVNDNEPEPINFIVELTFEPIKQNLKRDLKNWADKRQKRAEAGKIGGLKRAENASNNKQIQATLESDEQIQSIQPVNVSVNVNDSVNVTVPLEKETKFIFSKELIKYGIDQKLVSDWMLVRKQKKAANTETAFKAVIREIEKTTTQTPNEIIQTCIERSWSGFKSEWIVKQTNNQNNGNTEKPTRENVKQGYLESVLRGNQ